MFVPHRIMHAIGSRSCFSGRPVRALTRLTTGTSNVASAWLWITADRLPTSELTRSETRSSMPPARRRIIAAALLSMPVRSRPAPMIMTAISEITALPANPSKSCSTGIEPRHADDDDDEQCEQIAADPLQHQHDHGERQQPEDERHAGGQGQAGFHRGGFLLSAVLWAGSGHRRSVPVIDEIPDAVPEPLATPFEVGVDAPRRPRSRAPHAQRDGASPARCRARSAYARHSPPSRSPNASVRRAPGAMRRARRTRAGSGGAC